MFCCVKNRLFSLCLVIVNWHSSADTLLKTNCKDETAGAEHGIFLDLDRSFSPSITSAAKKRVMMFFVEISDFF